MTRGSTVIAFLILASVTWAVIAVQMSRWNDLVVSVLIATGVPMVLWARYRRRALVDGYGAHGLLSWSANGAPRDGAS